MDQNVAGCNGNMVKGVSSPLYEALVMLRLYNYTRSFRLGKILL